MYKIYFGEVFLLLTKELPAGNSGKNYNNKNNKLLAYKNELDLKESLSLVQSGEANITIIAVQPELLLEKIFNDYLLINAAGGLVKNEKDEMLMIFRRNKWDLPKGKIEANEDIEKAAIREVKEETGLKTVRITKKITETYHAYSEKGVKCIKKTYWFEMMASSIQKLVPQIEESISKAEWKDQVSLSKAMKKTFPNIVDVINWYLRMN